MQLCLDVRKYEIVIGGVPSVGGFLLYENYEIHHSGSFDFQNHVSLQTIEIGAAILESTVISHLLISQPPS